MELRTLTTADELRQVYGLEQEIWGYQGPEDSVPPLMLLVSTRIGGLVIGAFEGGRIVGFAFAMPGVRDSKPYQWSHMLGVAPAFRDAGLASALKLEQRRLVMASGLDLVRWTYDPLQAANAHLNFTKLGVLAREYHRDAYPGSTSDLHAGTATDRLVAEWRLDSERVKERCAAFDARCTTQDDGRARLQARSAAAAEINRVTDAGSWIAPDGHDLSLDAPELWLTIPVGFTGMQQQDLALAREWRAATREMFGAYLSRGYLVADFALDRAARRGRYLLSRA
jgi:predicted GNAT superfamily acetyltransferase